MVNIFIFFIFSNLFANSNDCLVDKDIIEEVIAAKKKINDRNIDLDKKEEELLLLKKEIERQFKELEGIQKLINKKQEELSLLEQNKVKKIVETLYTMSPKASAKILSNLNDQLAVAVINNMETAKLAKILNLIDPIRSSYLSELMTGFKKDNQKENRDVRR